ncbi:hypothetical protein KBD69_02935 [Candidatus Woesebacteria bacterium]|nr:hypothetical protein [Candidatus Woesebacteria bacterium]
MIVPFQAGKPKLDKKEYNYGITLYGYNMLILGLEAKRYSIEELADKLLKSHKVEARSTDQSAHMSFGYAHGDSGEMIIWDGKLRVVLDGDDPSTSHHSLVGAVSCLVLSIAANPDWAKSVREDPSWNGIWLYDVTVQDDSVDSKPRIIKVPGEVPFIQLFGN